MRLKIQLSSTSGQERIKVRLPIRGNTTTITNYPAWPAITAI